MALLSPLSSLLIPHSSFFCLFSSPQVREVISALPEGKDDPGAIIKVWNRDNSDRVTFDQWILHEEKIQRDREENEQMVQTSNVLLGVDAGGSSIGGTGVGTTKKSEASISSTAGRGGDRGGRGGDFSGSASSNHDFGMDVTKLADQQGKKDMKRSRQKVSGKDTVDFCKYIDLFLFLLFITLFGNTLFMRRNVYRSGLTRAGVVEVLFGDSHVHVTPARSQVLYQGLTVGTQSVASVAASGVEMLKVRFFKDFYSFFFFFFIFLSQHFCAHEFSFFFLFFCFLFLFCLFRCSFYCVICPVRGYSEPSASVAVDRGPTPLRRNWSGEWYRCRWCSGGGKRQKKCRQNIFTT